MPGNCADQGEPNTPPLAPALQIWTAPSCTRMAKVSALPKPAPGRQQQPSVGVVVVPVHELQQMISNAVQEALEAQHEAEQGPLLLLDRRAMARALGVGVDTLDRLRSEGCPEVLVGDMPRFVPGDVLTWLRSRGSR